MSPPPDDLATVDHAIPVSRGGTNDPINLVAACYRCNIDKGDHTLQEYTAMRGSRSGRGLDPEVRSQAVSAQKLRDFYRKRAADDGPDYLDPELLQGESDNEE